MEAPPRTILHAGKLRDSPRSNAYGWGKTVIQGFCGGTIHKSLEMNWDIIHLIIGTSYCTDTLAKSVFDTLPTYRMSEENSNTYRI